MEIEYSLFEIKTVAARVLEACKYKTLLFYGEMGAGKTTLIKAMVEVLGSEEGISSPTFSLVNIYETTQGSVNHFDFYRIQDETEALDIGIDEYLDSGDWNFVEWPQKIEEFVDTEHHIISIKTLGSKERMLKFS